jgi:hypothetical protein
LKIKPYERFLLLFSLSLVSVILIASPTPAVYAGIGNDHDSDGDDYSPNEGDCDDTDPNVYPGQGCNYPVREDVEAIQDEVDDLIQSGEFDINSAQADNLIYKLYHAVEKTEDGKINTAVNMLNSFINNIQAYINSGAISQENGNGLISAVQGIIDYLEGN